MAELTHDVRKPSARAQPAHTVTHADAAHARIGRPAGPTAPHATRKASSAGAKPGQAGRRDFTAIPVHGPAVSSGPLSDEDIAHLDLSGVQAHLQENQLEASRPLVPNDQFARLEHERQRLYDRYAQLSDVPLSEPTDPQATAEIEAIDAELGRAEPLVEALIAGAFAQPESYALNRFRNMARELAGDEEYIDKLTAGATVVPPQITAALNRVRALRAVFNPALAKAEKWHADNPVGESLGMMNERAGTWFAGHAREQWEKGGWHRLAGLAAGEEAFNIAVLDAAEKLLSGGYHETATEVAEAYARGDISSEDVDDILRHAFDRAIAVALATRGLGAATRPLGGAAAEAVGLGTEGLVGRVVSGTVSSGLTGVGSLGAQAATTALLQQRLSSPSAREIWSHGMPKGRDWAIAIPVSMLLGGLGEARAGELRDQSLVGQVIDTPEGRMRVLANTGDTMVLRAESASRPPPAAPPPAEIPMVYDTESGAWVAEPGPGVAKTAPPAAQAPPADSLRRAIPEPASAAPSLPRPAPPRALPIQPTRLLPPGTPPSQTAAGPPIAAKRSLPAKPSLRAEPALAAKPSVSVRPALPAVSVTPALAAKPSVSVKPPAEAKPPLAAKPSVSVKPPAQAKPPLAAKPPIAAKPSVSAKPPAKAKPAAPAKPATPAQPVPHDPLVAVKISGPEKGQFWEEGSARYKTYAARPGRAPSPAYIVLPKTQAEALGFRPAGTAPDLSITPQVSASGEMRESLGARRTTPHPITARTARKPTGPAAAAGHELEAPSEDPSAQHAFRRTIQADIDQANGYKALLAGGERGLLRPGNVSTGGVDAITAKVDSSGKVTIYLNDFTSPGTGKPPKETHRNWLEELDEAIAGDRLNLNDKKLEDAIRHAAAHGPVYVRPVRVTITGIGKDPVPHVQFGAEAKLR